MKSALRHLLIISIFLQGACVHAEGNKTTTITAPTDSAFTRLSFFSGNEAKNALSLFLASNAAQPLSQEDLVKEKTLLAACNAPEGQREFFGMGMLLDAASFTIQKSIEWIIEKVDEKLQKELQKYTATFRGTQTVNLYQKTQNGPLLTYDCFRLTRLVEEQGKARIAMDFIGKVEIESGESFAVTPLRLYYAKSMAETDSTNRIGVAISMKLDIIWRENNKGISEKGALDSIIHSEGIILPTGTNYAYHNYNSDDTPDKKDKRVKTFPLPAWSTYDNVKYGSNTTEAAVTVVETGIPSWLLKKSADLFHGNKDKLSTQLSKAAQVALEQQFPKQNDK